ncbi:MAG TPA: winged helix-turn-helix domain-containing protein [Thermoplasmata archaeon]|nr:winged helix-turn-helix domain-containing protein [Thermoplasmata archaeon]
MPEPSAETPVYGTNREGPLGARRSPLDLYAELLEVLRRTASPCRITRLSYAVGMPVDRTHRAVNFLVQLGLVGRTADETPAWRLTRRGYDFLQTYWKLRSFLGPVEGFVG